LFIQGYLQWKDRDLWLNNEHRFRSAETEMLSVCTDLYRQSGIAYPKFFKMDLLSKAAFLAATLLLPETVNENKDKVAVVLSSCSGCLDVDHKFEESRATLASPGLFVYTLPNIMLGEICIAKGFKGEQMCTLQPAPDAEWLDFYVSDLMRRRGSEAVLCGHVEATEHGIETAMTWVTRQPSTLPFTPGTLETIFSKIT